MKTKSNDRSVLIVENGEQLTVSSAVASGLVASDLIYLCPDCGKDFYHVNPFVEVTLDDIENRCHVRTRKSAHGL